MSLKSVQSSLLSQIGFSELEQQVYLTILGIGYASLGEMNLQTGLPLEELQTTINDLANRGYLKKIEGKINRYFAVEPFLKGFLFVEKEFQNDIINIENSLISVFDSGYTSLANSISNFQSSIPTFFNKIAKELLAANEQLKMELTNSIYRHSDKITNLAEDFDLMLTDGFSKTFLSISNELSNLTNEVGVILRDETDQASARLQKFNQITTDTIQNMISPLENALIEYNTTAPEQLNIILDENKEEVGNFQKNVKSMIKFSIKELTTSLKDFEKEITDFLTITTKTYLQVVENYRKASKDIFNTEKAKIDGVVSKLIDQIGKNIDQLAVESTNLKENIEEISKAGLLKKPDPAIVKEAKDHTDKIYSISQKIKTAYNDALNVYQKGIVEGITQLMKSNDEILEKQLKESSAQLKEIKVRVSTKWTDVSKKYETDMNDAVKDILNSTNPKITTTAKLAFENTLKYLEQIKKNVSEILLPLKEVVYTDIEDALESLFMNSSKRLRIHNESNNKTLETIRYLTDDMKFAFKSQVLEELSKPKSIASEMVSEYSHSLDKYLASLNKDHSGTVTQISQATEKFLTIIKDSFTNSSSEISNRLAGIIYKVNETKTYLQEITNSVDRINPVARPHSLIIYGNQNSLNAIYDMLMRTASTCTIVVPTIDQNLVELLTKKISKRVRIRVLADVDPFKDEALVAALKDHGNITLWQYTARDFFAVTRDGAEVLLAPLSREGELTSFLTEQDALVRAVQQIINASFMARSKEI